MGFYGCFISGSAVITPPPYGTFGNMARNLFRGPGYANLDFSVAKRWQFNEKVSLQLRGEFFNLWNYSNFDGLYTIGTDLSDPVAGINDLGVVSATPDVGICQWLVQAGRGTFSWAPSWSGSQSKNKFQAPGKLPGGFFIVHEGEEQPHFPKIRDGAFKESSSPKFPQNLFAFISLIPIGFSQRNLLPKHYLLRSSF